MSAGIRRFDGIGLCRRGDVALVLWVGDARKEPIAWMGRELAALAAEHESIVVCQLILPSSSPPDGPGTKEAKKMLAELEPKLRRLVSVALGDSMWTSIVRAIMRAMVLVSRHSHLAFVSANAAEGFRRIQEVRSANTPGVADLHQAAEDLARALGVTLPRAEGPRSASGDAL